MATTSLRPSRHKGHTEPPAINTDAAHWTRLHPSKRQKIANNLGPATKTSDPHTQTDTHLAHHLQHVINGFCGAFGVLAPPEGGHAARVQSEAVGFLPLLCRQVPIPWCRAAPEPPVFIFLTPSHHSKKRKKRSKTGRVDAPRALSATTQQNKLLRFHACTFVHAATPHESSPSPTDRQTDRQVRRQDPTQRRISQWPRSPACI